VLFAAGGACHHRPLSSQILEIVARVDGRR
jgi:hypothetical protein